MRFFSPAYEVPTVCEAVKSFYPRWLDKHHLPESRSLYHYTTLAGMRGILSERSLWFGHVSSFNDPNEIQYGKKVISQLLEARMQEEDDELVRRLLGSVLSHVQAFATIEFHPFLACFCQSDNLLSQWRAYADEGAGYCLGLSFSPEIRISSNPDRRDAGIPILRKVIYEREEQEEVVTQYLQEVIPAAKEELTTAEERFGSSPGWEKRSMPHVIGMEVSNLLLELSISFKDPAFAVEKEWRLIQVFQENDEPEKLQFREPNGRLVPYRSNYLFDEGATKKPRFPLTSITFGPSLDPFGTRSAIELLLHHLAATNHPIELDTAIQIHAAGYELR